MAAVTWRHAVLAVALVACLSLANASEVNEEMWTKFMFKYQNHTTCGRRMASMDNAIEPETEADDVMTMMSMQAANAQEGEFPWQAAIFLHKQKVCGAALVHEEWLLTSASCLPFLKDPKAYTVVMGTLSGVHSDIVTQDSANKQSNMVEGLYVHPYYDAHRWEYDLALVKVKEAFTLNDYVNVVCLPLPMMQPHFHAGVKATVAAFGTPSMMMMEPQCPEIPESSFQTCTNMCERDSDCGEKQKCCGDECKRCVPVTAPTDSPMMESAIMPGTLHKLKLPLLEVSACESLFNGNLAKSLFCAGGEMMMMMGGDHQMMEGGLIPFLKKKILKMKMEEMDMDEEEMMDEEVVMEMMERMKEEGDLNFDMLSILSHLQKSVDMMEGGVGREGMRKAGAWSLGYEKMMEEGEEDDREEEVDEEEEGNDMMMRGMGERDMEMGKLIKHMMEAGKDKEEIMKMMMMKQCKGDKGGPLVSQVNGQWYLIGVTSLPYGCLHQGSPGLFSQVDVLKDWIKPIFNGKEPNGKSKHCGMGEFSCGDGWCIPEEQRCDGRSDCTLGTDEHFCKGALKGYNVYFDQALDNDTVAHKFAVHSPEQCALACFKAPFLCPGFDVYVLPDSMMMPDDVPTMMPTMEEMADMMGEGGDSERDDDGMMGDKMPKIVCKLADTMSMVVHKNMSMDKMNKSSMMMADGMMSGGMMSDGMMSDGMMMSGMKEAMHFHFKLPRLVPLAALLSPKFNLPLPRGVIVSPSYILGENISRHIGDHRLALLFAKKALTAKLVHLAEKACFMHHDNYPKIEELKMWLEHLGEMGTKMEEKMMTMMMMMSREDEMDNGEMTMNMMMEMKKNMTWAVEHAKELHMNYTMLLKEVMMSCNKTNITHHVHQMLKEILVNYTCDKDGVMNDMNGTTKMSEAFEMLMKKIGLYNMYKLDMMRKMKEAMMGEDMGTDGEMDDGMMGTDMMDDLDLEGMIMERGSMMGDIWSILGNDDAMSMMMTEMMEDGMQMEGKDMEMNITVKKHMVVMKITKIAMMLMMASCNVTAKMEMMGMGSLMDMMMMGGEMMMGGDMGGAMGGDMRGDMGWTMGGDMYGDMGGDMKGNMTGMHNMTKEEYMMLEAMKMMKKMSKGHHMWTIMQSPHRINNFHFSVLDSRGPYRCDNVPKDFGLMVARGGKLPVPKLIHKEVLKMKAKMTAKGGEMTEMMMEKMEEKVMQYMASMMPPEMMEMMTMMMMGDEGMGEQMGDMEGMMSNMMEMVFEMMMGGNMMGDAMMNDGMTDGALMGESMMGDGMMDDAMMGESMMGDGMMGGEMDKMMSEEKKKYLQDKVKEVLVKMMMKEGLGLTKCLGELKEKKDLWFEGSHALIDQYSNMPHSHGVIMEYGSGFACDKTITEGPGILTSPMFPMEYPSNVACNHKIVAPPGHVVVVFMLRFKTQWHAHCMHDKFTVYDYDSESDNWSKLGDRSFCGSMVPHVFRSSGQKLHVKFESDYSGEDMGFKAVYMFVPEYAMETMPLTGMPGEPTGRTPGEDSDNEIDRQTLERLWSAEDDAETYKIALIAVSCVLVAVLVITMVVMYMHFNNKIKKLSADGEQKTKL